MQLERNDCMNRSTEELEHYSAGQKPEEPEKAHPRPFWHRLLSWFLIAVVLFAFLGTCYWLAFYGRV